MTLLSIPPTRRETLLTVERTELADECDRFCRVLCECVEYEYPAVLLVSRVTFGGYKLCATLD